MINNPTDSVCDYLAELLYEAPAEANPVESVLVPAAPKPAGNPPPQPAKLNQAVVVRNFATDEAEPAPVDREKLARLLSSGKLVLAPEPTSASVKVAELLPTKPPAKPPAEKLAQAISQPTVARRREPSPLIIEPEPESVIEVAVDLEPTAVLEWCEDGRPNWAQARFDVLLFKVYGLTLAVPLIALGHIQPITEKLSPLFGQADWFMGLQPTPMGQIKTVNTALFVMPERYDKAFLDSARYVISIDGMDWGLAVDSVEQPISLDPDEVKWRGSRAQRPWLAGTIKEHMCALLDVPNMGRLLLAADRNKAQPSA